MTLLAQAAPSFTAGQLAAFLGILAFLVGLALGLKKLFGHEPPLHKEYATRTELDRMQKEVKDDLTKAAGSRKGTHEKIELIRAQQARLEAQNEFQTQQLSRLDGKIDRILERLPRSHDS